MSYGVPYKGSKSRIVKQLSEAIPKADVFCDLFAGGCAVTHRMMELGKFGRYIANDLDGRGVRLFKDSVDGKYSNETRWISREDFKTLRYTDPYVGLCWSFGNNGEDYLYSRKIEPYKKTCHYAIVLRDFTLLDKFCPEVVDACKEALVSVTDTHERRIKFGPAIVNWLKAYGTPELLESNPLYSSCHVKHDTKTRPKGMIRDLQRLQRLESLERLESLQRLESLERLEVSFKSYDKVEIPRGSVVYCDIPYRGTGGYGMEFDHGAFYDWCGRQTQLVLVSEYSMPEDRFAEVWSTSHRSTLSATANNAVTERLFVPKGQLGMYDSMMNRGKKWAQLNLFPE